MTFDRSNLVGEVAAETISGRSDSNAAPQDQFPLARIAAVLGRDVRNLRRAMDGREADGQCLVSGNAAKTYLLTSLPAAVQSELADLAEARGFSSPEQMLSKDEPRWEHPCKPSEIHPDEIANAQKRAAALANYCAAWSEGSQPAAELRAQALAAHQQALGYSISSDTLINILQRTIRRDGGRRDFGRWELYLPECPKRVRLVESAADQNEFPQFESYLSGRDTAAPSIDDRAWAWTAGCDTLQLLLEGGADPRRARRRVVSYMFERAPWLSRSKASLAKCFDEKWERYCAGERFICDRRPANSGNRAALSMTNEDEQKLIARSMFGGVTKAWRESMQKADISSGLVQRYIANPASKSYVPARIRDKITPKAQLLEDIHHGRRQADLNGAFITRDWSNCLPGDWQQADDCTLPLYFWENGEDGKPHAIRGQFLLMIDLSTSRALGFALHCERNYNARVIRGLMVSTHDSYGLPRKGYYFENGIWKSSRLIKGAADEVDGEDTERGMRDFGLRFVHAQQARAKVVERVLGILQTQMEDQPGYCGRDEKKEKFERLQKQLLSARVGKLEFQSFLLHRDEWVARLADICDAYNNEAQEGRLKGLSPREAWEKNFDYSQPLVRLDGPSRFLLANHRRPFAVTKNGIRINLGKESHWFRSEALAEFIGQRVQGYFDPEDMSSIWVQRRAGDRAPLVVPRAPTAPAMDATPEELGAAVASCEAFNRPARTLYKQIATYFPKNGPAVFRANLVSPAVAEQSEEIRAQQEEIRAAQGADSAKTKQLVRYTRRFGSIPNSDAVSPERRLKALKLLEESNSADVD